MNSTMDDNRLLTLPSNERIRLLPHMKLIFEIRNLKLRHPRPRREPVSCTCPKVAVVQHDPIVDQRVVPEYAVKAKWKNLDLPSQWILELVDKYVPRQSSR